MARSNNRALVVEAREALDKFKFEVANEVGVTLKPGYNGDISTRDAGRIGGNMVRKMVHAYEQGLTGK
ncbi:MAG: alpha/beta-type small acid-soluble spore protein [Firmicutes bacterium]|nr:alpha/beta-type small acid-soluble spore protein [Bacillota bacterium]